MANQLEVEFFNIVFEFDEAEKKIGQHRELKVGKTIDEFNQRHGEIWTNHEKELVAEGFVEEPEPSEPARNPLAEIDDLRARIERLEEK